MASPGPLRRLAIPALAAVAVLAATPAAEAGHTTGIEGSRPTWATLANHRSDAKSGAKVVFSVWIGWRDQAQLQQLLADQQNPASPDYQRWLSPAQFRSRFAPAQTR